MPDGSLFPRVFIIPLFWLSFSLYRTPIGLLDSSFEGYWINMGTPGDRDLVNGTVGSNILIGETDKSLLGVDISWADYITNRAGSESLIHIGRRG